MTMMKMGNLTFEKKHLEVDYNCYVIDTTFGAKIFPISFQRDGIQYL